MKFEHLFSPMQVGKVTYRNRIVSAPMAFGLIVQNPDARDFTYRKLEASAKGGNGCVIVGETDVNFTDAVRIPGFRPFDFAKPEEDPETFDAVGEYARRIKRHGAVALAELVHCGKEKVPFGPGQEAIGPIETTNLAGVRVRPMNEDDMARIARDFAVSATYMQKAGFDGVLIHGGHGFLFTQFLSPLMNTRTDSYGGSLENRARFPLQILKAVREAVGPDFLVELRIDGTDHQPGGITPEETGAFVAMAEPYITSVHVTCGIYEASVKSGTESSMFHPHGLNIDNAAIIKKYTKLPVGAVGHCTINPLAHLPFDPDTLAPASKQETVLIVGGGAAGMQAAITACDRGQKVILAEQGPHLGGLLRFTDVDTDKPDLMNFKNLLVREVERRDIDVRLNTVITPENLTSFGADGVIFATGSLPSCPPVPGIGHAHKAMDMYDGNVKPGHKIVMVGGGLVGCEAGLFLQKTGHEVTVVELLDRLANESFGMYREALIWEMEKCGVAMLPKTRCLEITPTGVKVENVGGVQTLEADTVLFALGMKSVDIAPLKAAAEAAGLKTWVIGDAIQPGKVDQATRSAYLAGIEVGR